MKKYCGVEALAQNEECGFRKLFNWLETYEKRKKERLEKDSSPPAKDSAKKIHDYYCERDIERMESIASLISENSSTVLDVGAWDGYFGDILMERGKKTISVDITPKSQKVISASITDLPFEDKSFDVVTALEVLEHLDNKSLILASREMQRVARNQIIISVPFEEWPLDANAGHLQYFDSKRLEQLIPSQSVKVTGSGNKMRVRGIRKLLQRASKRAYNIYVKIFDEKYVETPRWLIVIYELG